MCADVSVLRPTTVVAGGGQAELRLLGKHQHADFFPRQKMRAWNGGKLTIGCCCLAPLRYLALSQYR